jgi:hypothetical protein
MEWLQHELTTTETGSKLSYKVDTCDGCKAGEPVVIFDDGRFPKQKLNALFQYSAWNLEIVEGLIIGITFCHSSKTLKEHTDLSF